LQFKYPFKTKNMRRKIQDRNVRKISKRGGSYSITIPVEMMRELKWREKQKIVFKKSGDSLRIVDWKK